MNEHSRATASMSVPVLLALCFGVGCAEGGIERSPGDVPTFHGTVDLEFGEIEDEDPYLFTRIESIVEDRRGRLLVADLQSHEVRVFGSEGDFRFRFGGQGEGPGELTQPCCLAFGTEGKLWVRESTRYSVFRLDGASAEYDGGARIAHVGIGMVAPITFDAEGRLVDIGSLMTEDGGATARLHHGIPDRKPPLADIFFDRSGRLWVEKTVAEGEEMREADVYAGSALVARYRWPRRVSVGDVPWVAESALYGTTRDSLDVRRVARVRFEPGSSAMGFSRGEAARNRVPGYGLHTRAAADDRHIGAQNETYPPIWKRRPVPPDSSPTWKMERAP